MKSEPIYQYFETQACNVVEVCHNTSSVESFFPKLLKEHFSDVYLGSSRPTDRYIETRFFLQGFDSVFDAPEDLLEFLVRYHQPHIIFVSRQYRLPREEYLFLSGSLDGHRTKLELAYPKLMRVNRDEGLFDIIYTSLAKVPTETACLEGLRLNRIGVFKDVELNFHPRITAICGLNGTGKTTLLRTLGLSLIGSEHKSIDQEKVRELYRVEHNYSMTPGSASIENIFTLGDSETTNHLTLRPDIEREVIHISGGSIGPALFIGSTMRALVLGFSQKRELEGRKGSKTGLFPYHPPKAQDLIPLINNEPGNGLINFMSWIANLDLEARKNPDSQKLIDMAFQLFSRIAGVENGFQFLDLKRVDPLELWIRTPESPNGIPYHLAGQGCQSIMGWVGHLLQRLSEVYADSENFNEEPFVALVDEIDAYLHPLWQRNLLKVLLDFFPKGQFIVTTHSPLIVEGLDDFHFIRLEQTEDGVVAHQENMITLGWNYNQLLKQLFGVDALSQVSSDRFHKKMAELEQRVEELEHLPERDPSRNESLEPTKKALELMRLSVVARDELDEARQRLKEKEDRLDQLIAGLESDH